MIGVVYPNLQSVIKIEVTEMKLKWALAELAKYKTEPLVLDGKVDLTNSLKARKKDILDATPVSVTGIIMLEGNEQYLVDLTLNTTLTLPSSRSLTPVPYEMNVAFTEIYLAPNLSRNTIEDLDDQIVITLEQDLIDLRKPIEDTLIASIPMKILSKEEQISNERPQGEDWELILEGEELAEATEESSAQRNPFGILKDLDLFAEDEE